MRVPIEVTDDLQRQLGCEGIKLESVFVESEAPRHTVVIFRVDPTRSWTTAGPVVKFSKRRFAIPRAEYLKLATPEWYRHYEGNAGGVHDEMEAMYREDVRSFLTRYGSMDSSTAALVTGEVAYVVDDFWMFCTSVTPILHREREHLRKQFAADCMTTIPDPSEFARELGAAFAAHSSWTDVDLSPRDEWLRGLRPSETGDKVVWVYHGPVCYADDAQKRVEPLDEIHRPAVVSFLKRQTFASHKEYRFTVKTNGKPRNSEFLLPLPPELRRLARIEWEGR